MGTSLNRSISVRKGTIKHCYPTVIYSTSSFFLLRGLKTWVEESLMGQRYNEWSTSVLQPWLQWSLSTAGWLAKLYSMCPAPCILRLCWSRRQLLQAALQQHLINRSLLAATAPWTREHPRASNRFSLTTADSQNSAWTHCNDCSCKD